MIYFLIAWIPILSNRKSYKVLSYVLFSMRKADWILGSNFKYENSVNKFLFNFIEILRQCHNIAMKEHTDS